MKIISSAGRHFSKWVERKEHANAAEDCAFLVISRKEDDPEEQALAPKFLSTSADMACTEGDQVIENNMT